MFIVLLLHLQTVILCVNNNTSWLYKVFTILIFIRFMHRKGIFIKTNNCGGLDMPALQSVTKVSTNSVT